MRGSIPYDHRRVEGDSRATCGLLQRRPGIVVDGELRPGMKTIEVRHMPVAGLRFLERSRPLHQATVFADLRHREV